MSLAEGAFSARCTFCDAALVEAPPPAHTPDRVVPFVLTRDQAAGRLRAHLAGRWFAPEVLRRAASPEALRAALVPHHVHDAVARTTFSASIGIYWYRTETYSVTVNGKRQTRTRRVRETEWYPLRGSHVRRWQDHLVSASQGLPEAEANALEPFDLGRALPYAPALVAGVAAELPTVDVAAARPVAEAELRRLERDVIASEHLPGDTHRHLESDTEVEISAVTLALLPVWIAVYRGPSGPVRLLVNGQTGEVAGAVPTSLVKVGVAVALGLAALFAVAGCLGGSSLIAAAVGGR